MVLAVGGLSIATGCTDDRRSEETPTTVSTPPTSAPVVTDADRADTAPTDGPPAPDPSTLPEATAPAGLGEPPLPSDSDEVVAVFEALPVELLGAARQVDVDLGTIVARYDAGDRECGEVGLQAIDLTSDAGSAHPDDWRADDIVALFATGADWDVEAAGNDAAATG